MNIEKAFTLTLEIEGLLALLQSRGDMAPTQVQHLLREKLSQLSAEVEDDFAPSSADELPGNAAGEDVADAAVTEEAPEAVEVTGVAVAEEAPETIVVEEAPEFAEVPENTVQTVDSKTSETAELACIENPRPQAVREPMTKLIAVNDKFLFRRELFGNNGCLYDDTLSLIARMDSPEDVFDYMTNDLCVDPENPVLDGFMAIVKRYMSK